MLLQPRVETGESSDSFIFHLGGIRERTDAIINLNVPKKDDPKKPDN